MTSSREELLFHLALTKPEVERAAWLDRECAQDPALRARLDVLLAAHARSETLLAGEPEATGPTLPLDLPDAPDEAVGQTLGRYKLLERVGEGGCGVVYVAEQTEPVRRRVALKVIKLGMDTKQVVARFEAERQALAMMDHPNIAKVLDAGTTDAGRPFFVMELVRGIKITDYCDQANLTTRDRLDLFIKVCQAIQHAHQKGIIHRDIKPSNILVTLHDGTPVPKVIDFGIAKATEGRLTDATVYTQLHQFIGTPAYMSPEQAEMSGLDIDTRSDIYSLGVLLYELLAGSTPFDARELMASGLDAMRRTIREKEPQRPSTRLATLGADQLTTTARRRSSDTSKLLHQLRGDLDWIVMKCLEKDRQRRYETANGLAADIKRHLDNEPVLARPPSAAYKFQKAYRRNKLVFAAGGAVVVGLLIGLAALAYALVRERALKSESARADSIATFVTGLLNEAVPQLARQGNSTGIRVLLESADRLVDTTLTNTPAAELTVRDAMQYFYGGRLDDYRSSRKQLARMESLLPLVPDDRLPPNHSRDDLRMDMAGSRLWAGAVTEGRSALEDLAEEFRRRGPAANPARARALAKLGWGLYHLNRLPEAERPLAEAYGLESGRNGPGFFSEDFAGHPYSTVLIRNGKYSLAEEVARTTVSRVHAELAKSGPWKASAELNAGLGYIYAYYPLAEALCRLGRFDEAERLAAEQMGPGAAHAWSPAQLKSFKCLQWGVQAWSGKWREAASGVVALATHPTADVWDWERGVTAALASGDTNAYARLCRWGRVRFGGSAEAESANCLFYGLILRPLDDDLSRTLPDLLQRMDERQDYHWSAINRPFLSAQLAYRKGEPEEALRFLDAWMQSKDERPVTALTLHYIQASALPDFWRAIILARLGRAEGAREAIHNGIEKLRAGFPPDYDMNGALMTFYASHALRQEALEVFRSAGIGVPDADEMPMNPTGASGSLRIHRRPPSVLHRRP